MSSKQVQVPKNYSARSYQVPIWQAFYPRALGDNVTDPINRIVLVWHRRAGKDKTAISMFIARAYLEDIRTGIPQSYLYLFPEISHCIKVVWEDRSNDGSAFIDTIPDEIIKKKIKSRNYVELINGTIIHFGGADNYDKYMGANYKGIVFSEYAIAKPNAWEHFQPMLTANGGWAIFVYTPRGKNHGYHLYKYAEKRMADGFTDWYVSKLNIEETKRDSQLDKNLDKLLGTNHYGNRVVTQQQFEDELAQSNVPEIVKQEYYVDFESSNRGSIFADIIETIRDKGQIGHFPVGYGTEVHTSWDLGISDYTSIWFFTVENGNPVIIDYWEESGIGFTQWIARVMKSMYAVNMYIFPHDIVQRGHEGISREDTAFSFGLDYVVAPKLNVSTGIELARQLLIKCKFCTTTIADEGFKKGVSFGLERLKHYAYGYDKTNMVLRATPLHNEDSHSADAFRTLAVGFKEATLDIPIHYNIRSIR